MRGDVGGDDVLVVLDPSIAPELTPPVIDGVPQLGVRPLTDFFVQSRARGPDHHEAVHERVVDWPLQSMPLTKLAVVVGIDRLPVAVDLAEMSRPRAVGKSSAGIDFFAVDRHRRLGVSSGG